MLHVFENTKGMVSPKTKEVAPYINASASGLPAAVDDGDLKVFETLASYGTPVPVPEGLEVWVMASNGFLLSVLG